MGFEQRDRIPHQRQVAGSGQTRRASADDRHATFRRVDLADGWGGHCFPRGPFLCHPIGGEPLQGIDCHRFIQFLTVALALTGVVADAAAGGGEGIALANQFIGFLEAAVGDQGHVALAIHQCRAGQHARSAIGLADGHRARNGLGVRLEDRLARSGSFIELAEHVHRAHLEAIAAGVALVQIDEARPLMDLDAKIPCLSLESHDVGVGDHVDVQMLVHLDQPGRDGAHRAVVGGEGLVQLGHAAADGGALFHQRDVEAGIGQIQGGLHPADARADDHHRAELAVVTVRFVLFADHRLSCPHNRPFLVSKAVGSTKCLRHQRAVLSWPRDSAVSSVR